MSDMRCISLMFQAPICRICPTKSLRPRANRIKFLKYGRIPRQEGKMVPTAAQVVESWAEPLLNEVGPLS